MKYASIFLFLFHSTILHAQYRTRYLANKQDRKYFDDKMEYIFNNQLKSANATYDRNGGGMMFSKDTFLLYIPFTPIHENELLFQLEKEGALIVYMFWHELLKEFPEIKIVSFKVPSIEGKGVTVNYHLNKDTSISFYSQLQKRWLTQRCKGPK